VPAGHVHPEQIERFTIVTGQLQFRIGRRNFLARAGETIEIPAGTAHWFGNSSSQMAQARVEVEPALRMEELLEATEAMSRFGHLPGTRLPRPDDLAMVLLEFKRELAVPNIPAILVRAVLAPLAWLGRHRQLKS
jgi:hypothetical protein